MISKQTKKNRKSDARIKKSNAPEITVILPCRNEEEALPFCLGQIKEVIKKNHLSAEIIVSDSSSDRSPEIAKREKVILLKHNQNGYGRAYLEAFKIAKGKYIFMADVDATYDFGEVSNFVDWLKNGFDLVIGNRFGGRIEDGAMSFSNKYIGNPILSFMIRMLFGVKIKDSQCGMRAIKKESLEELNLRTTGMEFASEMIVKAAKSGLKIKELPINYYKRRGKSKLKPFSDAYRHIRFMLLYSPLFLFFIPGIFLFLLGIISMSWLYFGSPNLFGVKFYYHSMFFSSALIIVGYQLIIFALFAKSYAINHLGEKSEKMEKLYKFITIERASVAGILLLVAGVLIYTIILASWIGEDFKNLNETKNSIIALTLIIFGTQTIFSSFMLSILSIKNK